jgi:asparagine synthase (glutamine-hydrolysing)
MCGIVGCVLKRPLNGNDLTSMRQLRDAQSFRGPDDAGEFYSQQEGIYFGHSRLSIVDLNSRSRQPMCRDNLVITFNGELYNFKEIRDRLSSYSFSTEGDTEVILRSWQSWGEGALDVFDGMFSFSLYDGNEVTLVTDPFGEKPLYYYEGEDGFYFASEAAPLIETLGLNFAPTSTEVSQFLTLGYILPPGTGYRNLRTIQPGMVLRVQGGVLCSARKYWSVPQPEKYRGTVKPVTSRDREEIKRALCVSLERRLNCDVQKGIFLSGGVDSVLLAALISKELGKSIDSYTVAFPDGGDETVYAQRIADILGLQHTVIDSRDSDLWVDLPKSLKSIYGVPNDNATSLAVYQMCKHVKKYMTVAISGLGGDELFAGYNRYRLLDRLRWYFRCSKVIAPALSVFAEKFPKAKIAARLLKGSRTDQFLAVKNSGFDEDITDLGVDHLAALIDERGDILDGVRYFDLSVSMSQSYIPAIERGSMRASVEVRAPFLSRDLLDVVSSFDQRALIRFGPKKVLRDILSEYIDLREIFQGKQGFIFPSKRYFLQRNLSSPTVSQLDMSKMKDLWDNREYSKNYTLLTRLAVLSEFNQSNVGVRV